MVGIVDQALEAGGSDSLEIASYHEALVDFIKKTDTPMTIGVQGEWGSGKTSLLNQIWNRLEESNNEHLDDENYLQIWVLFFDLYCLKIFLIFLQYFLYFFLFLPRLKFF